MRYIRTIVLSLTIVGFAFSTANTPAYAQQQEESALTLLEQTSEQRKKLVRRLLPTVVHINIKNKEPTPEKKSEKDEQNEQEKKGRQSLGSGFIIDARGIVVTNNHVVDTAKEDGITVVFNDEENTKAPARVISTDPYSDIALLQIDMDALPPDKRALSAAVWGDSTHIEPGDSVIAIGSPFGLSKTVTWGIVSTKNRILPDNPVSFIQIDAAVNRGNSGGPLFNVRGEVVGVNTAILSPSGANAGIAFAVPSGVARLVSERLAAYGRVRRGYMGVGVSDLNDEAVKKAGLPHSNGVFVSRVEPNGPADLGGMKQGDIILSWSGMPTKTLHEMLRIVADSKIGVAVPVEVWRDGQVVKLFVTPDERPREIDKKTKTIPLFPPDEEREGERPEK